MPSVPDLVVFIYTGKRKNAGTYNDVHLVLHSDDGTTSSEPINLDKPFTNDLESDEIMSFRVPEKSVGDLSRLTKIVRVEVWKDTTLLVFASDWFVDKIVVENVATNSTYIFPFFRWIKSNYHYYINLLDTSLPQYDEFPEQRKRELREKRMTYMFHQRIPDGPAQVKKLPPDEEFLDDFKWEFKKDNFITTIVAKISEWFTKKFKSIDDINMVYEAETFERPMIADDWNDDIQFGRQRIASMNPHTIHVLKEVPSKFPVTDELLGDLLQGKTIQDCIDKKRLFIADLRILEGIPTTKGFVLCCPIALFYLDDKERFLPVAIQLFQAPGVDNPIFTPKDSQWLWTVVKMWFNNSDAAYHQSLAHLGPTHLLMEGFVVATHRNLSPSHPIFKLLSPHFLYLIIINWKGLTALLERGGWTDKVMNYGAKGMTALILKGYDNFRLDVDGYLPENLKSRGFDDPDILPGYYFRDDAMLVFNAINKYVKSYVELYYTSSDVLTEDREIQEWASELVTERKNGGAGYKGVPGNGSLTSTDDLVKTLTTVIYTCSVAHASVNFPQYDEYGFPPNCPMTMRGTPPTSKDATITEADVLDNLPNKKVTFDIMTITSILSNKGTNSLGDFEVHYVFDPKALKVVEEFRADLKKISEAIAERNKYVHFPYDYLDPENIPNSISI